MGGKLVIISAPSGAGKTSIIREVLKSGINLEFSISACSRPMRKGEVNGIDYYFLSVEDFKDKIRHHKFLEWEEVYKDHYYGTLLSELDRIWKKGKIVLVEADVYGAIKIKNRFGANALNIFIMPPSIEELEERLIKRSTDKKENIKIRVAKAKEEIGKAGHFDKIIVNKNLKEAILETRDTIMGFLEKR